MTRVFLFLLAFLTISLGSMAEASPCEERRIEVERAKERLFECVTSAETSCADERRAIENARAALRACLDGDASGLDRKRLSLDVSAIGGAKALNPAEWAPVAAQPMLGAGLTIGIGRRPLRAIAEARWSQAYGHLSNVPVRGSTSEVSVGWAWEFPEGMWVGAGPTFITVDNTAWLTAGKARERGQGVGAWAVVGATYEFSSRVLGGGSIRYSHADVRLNEGRIAAGGLHAAISITATVGPRR